VNQCGRRGRGGGSVIDRALDVHKHNLCFEPTPPCLRTPRSQNILRFRYVYVRYDPDIPGWKGVFQAYDVRQSLLGWTSLMDDLV